MVTYSILKAILCGSRGNSSSPAFLICNRGDLHGIKFAGKETLPPKTGQVLKKGFRLVISVAGRSVAPESIL